MLNARQERSLNIGIWFDPGVRHKEKEKRNSSEHACWSTKGDKRPVRKAYVWALSEKQLWAPQYYGLTI